MIVSVGLPTCMEGMMYPVPFASVEQVVQIAKRAEALGYDSVWGNDHMSTQRYVREEFSSPPNFFEPLITYAYLAAETERLRFGTGLLVLPMRRDIVVLAKQVATLDHLSGGRLVLSLGVGAYREEFEALHPDMKAHRGSMLEEGVQALRRLFSERVASWRGTYYAYQDVELFPKPLQQPFPIYIGGNSEKAVRRTALYGNGWLPAGMPADQLQDRIEMLRGYAEAAGRDAEEIEIAVQYIVYVGRTHEEAVGRFHRSQMYKHLLSLSKSTLKEQAGRRHEDINLIGTAQEIIEKAAHLKEIGVNHLCGLYFCADEVDELLDQMQRFAEEVKPHLE